MSKVLDMLSRLVGPRRPEVERRLHRRAVLAWRNALGSDAVVSLERFDLVAIEDRSNHGFLLDLRGAEPMLAYIGPVLMEEAGLQCAGVPLQRAPDASLIAQFAAHYPRAQESGEPISAEYEFVTPAHFRISCRGALLPLSSDGATIDHVYGVISWKSERVAAAAA